MATPIPPKRKKAKFFSLLLILTALAGGGYWWKQKRERDELEPQIVQLTRFQEQQPLMGTLAVITLYAEDEKAAKKAFAQAFARGQELNKVASDYLSNSELTQLNTVETGVWFTASDDLLRLVAFGLELAELTNGAYDPTLGTMTHLWRETKKAGQLPSSETLDQVQGESGWEHLELDLKKGAIRKNLPGLRLDLGGIAKGYAADEMLVVLQNLGIPQALVVNGGDVRCGNAPPHKSGWMVGLQNHKGELESMISVSDCAVSTSGDLQQFVVIEGQRFSHIIEPRTGLGLTDSLMATVVADAGIMADPLATAACLDPNFFEALSPSTNIHSRILSTANRQVSARFPAEVPYQALAPSEASSETRTPAQQES